MTAAPRRPRLAFISPVFLFPNDAGGKIRTTNILRGLKGRHFELTLLSPVQSGQAERWRAELDGVCDEFIGWPASPPRARWRRALDLLGDLPVNVAADRSEAGQSAVRKVGARSDIDLLVFDFVHSAVLRSPELRRPAVCFTHNVEAEIFQRHARQATDPARRWMWASQHRKMERFERHALRAFTRVIAVSERDARFFRDCYGVAAADAIPTGVDLDFFAWQRAPVGGATVVFTGSMDWAANIDGMHFFLRDVWPRILQQRPEARLVVVGRNPPPTLLALAGQQRNVEFTGFVDDVRPYVYAAQVFVIPLLVGGGTRIKAFEAMAMGCPVVSTAIGIEGLGAEAGRHFAQADTADDFAASVLALLSDRTRRETLALAARELVEMCYGHLRVASAFESICRRALEGA